MTIASLERYRYTLPLTEPLSLGGAPLAERHGLLLHLTLDSGADGWGEAAPLPGFSVETLDEAVDQARRLGNRWEGETLTGEGPRAIVRALPIPDSLPASVRFGGESAVVEALAAAQGIAPARLLGADRPSVALNALVRAGDADTLADQGRRLRADGYQAVKLKVGRTDVSTDVERVRALRRGLGPDVELRLDANRAWSVEDAEAFLSGISDCPFAYIEEPVSDPEHLPALVEATGCPVAIDETTRERSREVLGAWPLRAVVLKPTLLGGMHRMWAWEAAARDHGVRPVLSASYETGVGTRMLAAVAATLSEAPAGLSPYTRLAADVLAPRLSMDGPTVDLAAVSRSTVCLDRLEPLVD